MWPTDITNLRLGRLQCWPSTRGIVRINRMEDYEQMNTTGASLFWPKLAYMPEIGQLRPEWLWPSFRPLHSPRGTDGPRRRPGWGYAEVTNRGHQWVCRGRVWAEKGLAIGTG